MRKSTQNELRKLREFFWFTIIGKKCYFCKEELCPEAKDFHPGLSAGPPVRVRVSIHHKDGDHYNDSPKNHALCHESCHKSYHARHRERVGGQFKLQKPWIRKTAEEIKRSKIV